MKSLSVFCFFTVVICGLNFPQSLNAQEILDKQIAVNSIDELDKLTLSLRNEPKMRLDWDAFNQAVTYIAAYVSAENDLSASADEKNRMIKILVSGRTPREIIILGHIIWLEQTKQDFAEVSAKLQAPNISATEIRGLQLAKSLDLGNERIARDVIKRYLVSR